jgi:hypothetical protein
MAVVAIVVLIASGRTRARAIAVIALLVSVGWICYGAADFWSGQIQMLIGGLGDVGGNVNAGLANRAAGSSAHELAGHVREFLSALVWLLALLGAFVWRPRNGDRAVLLLLFFGSFSMIAGGNYGGEAILRIYLFSLPASVCLIAVLISKLPQFWQGQVAFTLALAVILPLFLVARWGNELYEMVRPDELSATAALYDMAPPGSNLVSVNSFIALWYPSNILEYEYSTVELQALDKQAVSEVTKAVAGDPKGGFVEMTADQREYGTLVLGLPGNWSTTLESELAQSPHYKLRYSNPDSWIFQYIPTPATKAKKPATKTPAAAKTKK